MKILFSIESVEEFINPKRIRVTNGHLIIMLILFTMISWADAVTSISAFILGGTERNRVMILLLNVFGPQVLFTSKMAVIGGISGFIAILWRWRGIQPYRFFWVITSITLATMLVVLANLTIIFRLLNG